jgi:uracil phosphoribosyltransferase
MWINASKSNVLVSELIGKLRDKRTSPVDFRTYLKRLGNFLAYEAAKQFTKKSVEVETPLGKAVFETIEEDIVIVTILRAALPMSEGVLEVIPRAKVGVISASRGKQIDEDGTNFRIDCTYSNIPFLENKTAIIVDPMLASGSTLSFIIQQLEVQKPSKLIILSAIASKYGVQRIIDNHPQAIIITGEVDQELNSKGYIVPGLGDAGDRAFNT